MSPTFGVQFKAEGISIETGEEELLLFLAFTTGVGSDLGDLLGL
jgi:hypothetical protein